MAIIQSAYVGLMWWECSRCPWAEEVQRAGDGAVSTQRAVDHDATCQGYTRIRPVYHPAPALIVNGVAWRNVIKHVRC